VKVTVQFSAQLRAAAQEAVCTVDATEGSTVQDVIRGIAEEHGGEVRSLLLDEAGELSPSVLIFADGQQVLWEAPCTVAPDQTVIITTPIAGG
jgi:molybdopterin converting factor small subunit